MRAAPLFRPLRLCSLFMTLAVTLPARAPQEWHNLHTVYSANNAFPYPFDGRSPKVAAALLNHYPTAAPATIFTLIVNDQRMEGGGFTQFPNGGSIVAGPDEYGIASAFTGGIYDGRAGAAPAI